MKSNEVSEQPVPTNQGLSAAFREFIKARLESSKMTVARLSAESGVKDPTLRSILYRQGRVSLDDAVAVLRALKISPSDYFAGRVDGRDVVLVMDLAERLAPPGAEDDFKRRVEALIGAEDAAIAIGVGHGEGPDRVRLLDALCAMPIKELNS